MTNQLIQDPNKATATTNAVRLKDIAEPISYFLAGGFLVGTTLPPKPTEGAIKPTDWFTFVVGAFLILSGCIFIIANLPIPLKGFTSFRENFKRIYNKYVYSIVFIVVVAKVIFTTIGFASYPPLYYIGFAFLLMILLEMILPIKDIRCLLAATLIFVIYAIYLLLTRAPIIQPIFMFAIAFVNLVVAIFRACNKSRKPPIKSKYTLNEYGGRGDEKPVNYGRR